MGAVKMMSSKLLLLLAVLGAHEGCYALSTEKSPHAADTTTRRQALTTLLSPIIALTSFGTTTTLANAAPPMTAGEADNIGARFERSMRKKPPRVLRSKLNLEFGVLLMRSSYNAVDELDVVAMDQFQRDFFFIRQAEYSTYLDLLGPGAVQQGDLTDPAYFDFISFAQYAAVNRFLSSPENVFEEQQPVEVPEGEPQKFVPTVIKRKVEKVLLPATYDEMVGEKILDRLNEIFGSTEAQIPAIDRSSDSATVLKALKQLSVLFQINGFAFESNAAISKDSATKGSSAAGTEFTITLTAPATLWSGQALQLRRGVKVTNDFFLKTASALLRRAGFVVSNSSVKYTSNQEITTFTIS